MTTYSDIILNVLVTVCSLWFLFGTAFVFIDDFNLFKNTNIRDTYKKLLVTLIVFGPVGLVFHLFVLLVSTSISKLEKNSN